MGDHQVVPLRVWAEWLAQSYQSFWRIDCQNVCVPALSQGHKPLIQWGCVPQNVPFPSPSVWDKANCTMAERIDLTPVLGNKAQIC